MYLAIFSQFFCDLHAVSAHPINLKGLVVIFIFLKDLFIFSRVILQNSRTKAVFFFKFKEFSKTSSNSKTFPGLCEPCKSMSHIICQINPQIQFVDICWGHEMSLTVFIHSDLDLRSQFWKKCTHSRSPILFMVAFYIWYVDTSWALASHKLFPGHCHLDLWFQL